MSTWSVVYPKAGIEPEFLFFMQYQGEVKLNPDGVLCKSFKSSGLLKAAGGAAGAGGGPQIQPPVHGVQIKLKQFFS
jgi:hypothetical protein